MVLPTLWRPSLIPAPVDDGQSLQPSTARHDDSVESSDPGTGRATASVEWPVGQEARRDDPLCTVCNQVCEPKLCKSCTWCLCFIIEGVKQGL